MKSVLQNFAASALIGLLLILPLITMEIVNRRKYEEDFPFVLFFGMWEILFAISLILLPLARAGWSGKHDRENPGPKPGSMLLANPKSSALVSIAIFLALGLLDLLNSLGWLPLQTLINGPTPEVDHRPALLISSGIFWLTVTAAIIANVPVVRTLQAKGSLFTHPVNIIIVVLFVSFLVIGVTSLVIDQWSCFMDVPMCD